MALNYYDKKYSDDTIFQSIERNYLTLKDEDVKKANEFLKYVIERYIIPLMREDELFHLLFQRIVYGGSFYKGTRYGKPEEFDLDLVMKLPFSYDYLKIDTNHTNYGYVKIKVNPEAFKTANWINHRHNLSKWITPDNYLDQNKFRNWMESVVASAISKLIKCPTSCRLHTHVVYKKAGPAFTLTCDNAQKKIKLDIDLVPVIEFDNVQLGNGYRVIKGNKKTWIAVAKPRSIYNDNVFWRLGFYEPEKEFLRGELKPVIRMLKKFRDTMHWDSIASYYLETLLYNELENRKYELDRFLRTSKTWLFIHALKKLAEALENHYLPYYWNPKYNLLNNISKSEIYNYANHLNKKIRSIDACIEDESRMILAEVILDSDEVDQFKREHTWANFSKLRKQLQLI